MPKRHPGPQASHPGSCPTPEDTIGLALPWGRQEPHSNTSLENLSLGRTLGGGLDVPCSFTLGPRSLPLSVRGKQDLPSLSGMFRQQRLFCPPHQPMCQYRVSHSGHCEYLGSGGSVMGAVLCIHCKMFNSICGIYPLDASSIPSLAVTT